MRIGLIDNATRTLGITQGYHGLPIADVMISRGVDGEKTPAMVSEWHPTSDEIMAIRLGAPIYLTILGTNHPPVIVTVGDQS